MYIHINMLYINLNICIYINMKVYPHTFINILKPCTLWRRSSVFPRCRSNVSLRPVLYVGRICAQDLDSVPKDPETRRADQLYGATCWFRQEFPIMTQSSYEYILLKLLLRSSKNHCFCCTSAREPYGDLWALQCSRKRKRFWFMILSQSFFFLTYGPIFSGFFKRVVNINFDAHGVWFMKSVICLV